VGPFSRAIAANENPVPQGIMVRCAHALLECCFQIVRLPIFPQHITEGFRRNLIKALHLLPHEQVDGPPSFLVENDALASPTLRFLVISGPRRPRLQARKGALPLKEPWCVQSRLRRAATRGHTQSGSHSYSYTIRLTTRPNLVGCSTVRSAASPPQNLDD
jgi:hypothetical protein